MKSETVLMTKNYGKIKIYLKEYIEERGITRNNLAQSIGTRFEVVDRLYQGNIEKIDVDILARICYALKCDVSDIIKYEE